MKLRLELVPAQRCALAIAFLGGLPRSQAAMSWISSAAQPARVRMLQTAEVLGIANETNCSASKLSWVPPLAV